MEEFRKSLAKYMIIFRAINNGWTVKKIGNNEYQFIKNRNKILEEEKTLNCFLKLYLGI